MIVVIRSELVRLRRRGILLGWSGLSVLVAILINFVMFQVVKQGATPAASGPGVTFPAAAQLLSSHGIVSGLAAASSFFGVTALAFWAIAAASDYSTGLIRVIVAAEPRRWRLIAGKWVALAVLTAAATLVALLVNLLTAPIAASAGHYSPHAWGHDLFPVVLGATVNLYLALLIWGTLGLALAVISRSAGVAIGVGVGYVLLLEPVIKAAVKPAGDWLPGTTISAIAHGGTASLAYASSLGLGLAYIAVASAASFAVTGHRDITE